MTPIPCRVQAIAPETETETAGTLRVERSAESETLRITTTGSTRAVTATLTRDEAIGFLLVAADSLGLVLLDPKDAARRTAKLRRGR